MPKSTVDTLREQIEAKYREALRALDVIAGYLDSSSPSSASITPLMPAGFSSDSADPLTRVEKVLRVVADGFKTVDEIASLTGLEEGEVRAALYSRSAQHKLERKKIGKKMQFKLRPDQPVLAKRRREPRRSGASAASSVRALLSQHAGGLEIGEIRTFLEKNGVGRGAIIAALYNMKKRGQVEFDTISSTYRITKRGTEMDTSDPAP